MRRRAQLAIFHPKRKTKQVVLDAQTITLRTASGNLKVPAIVEIFFR